MVPRTLAVLAAASALAACSQDRAADPVTASTGKAYMRAFNSVWQTNVTVGTHNDTTIVGYTPVSIDVLLDSATSAPSLLAIAPNSMSVGTEGPLPGNLASGGYNALEPGVHSFVVRQSGLTPLGASFFTTTAKTQWLPKENLFATPYLFAIYGMLPPPIDTGPVLVPANQNPPKLIINTPLYDDKFPGPVRTLDGQQRYLARFTVRDMTVFPSGSFYNHIMYVTPGTVAPPVDSLVLHATPIGTYYPLAYVSSFNLAAGDYVVTVIGQNNAILVQMPFQLNWGEVRTLILANSLPTGVTQMPASGVPSGNPAGYFKLLNLLDNQY